MQAMARQCSAMSGSEYGVQAPELPSDSHFIIGTVFPKLRRTHLHHLAPKMKVCIAQEVRNRCHDAARGNVQRWCKGPDDFGATALPPAMRRSEAVCHDVACPG